jgi:hypothetical protein
MPVLAGILFFATMFGLTWLVDRWAESVAEDGPIIYPDLRDPEGTRAIVVDHQGDDPATGWRVFYTYPADRDSTCQVEQRERTRTFTDCDGRELDIEDLKRPLDVRPIVENRKTLYIDLRQDPTP